MTTSLELYRQTVSSLSAAGSIEAETEATHLLCHILGCRRVDIFLNRAEVGDACRALVDEAIARRQQREPLAYILGEQEFYGRAFTVSPDVLIPRPETEILVERAVAVLRRQGDRPQALDLGTGSGIIAITLALEVPEARVMAVDISLAALRVAKDNAVRHGVGSRLAWVNADWGAAVSAHPRFSLVAANPPYVARRLAVSLQPELGAEPAGALYGGEDGCREINRIMDDAHRLLLPGGVLLMEIGYDQGEHARTRMCALGHYEQIDVHLDYAGLPRILEARRHGP